MHGTCLGGSVQGLPGSSLPSSLLAAAAHHPIELLEESEDELGADYEIERWWQSTSFVKISHPQFGPGKFPFSVSVILKNRSNDT